MWPVNPIGCAKAQTTSSTSNFQLCPPGLNDRLGTLAPMTSPSSAAGKLRVAMLAPISWRVPPRHYGPWELFVSLLTEGLVGRGVDVTLFATGDSLTRGRLVGSAPRGYSEDPELDA